MKKISGNIVFLLGTVLNVLGLTIFDDPKHIQYTLLLSSVILMIISVALYGKETKEKKKKFKS